MTDTTDNTFDLAPPPADPYLDHLDPDDQIVYKAASSGSDLTYEIRLIRTILARLSSDIPKNHRDMGAPMSILIRAIQLQAKQRSTDGELEQAVHRAAELVLADLDGKSPDAPRGDA